MIAVEPTKMDERFENHFKQVKGDQKMSKQYGLDYYLQNFSRRDPLGKKCVTLLQQDISGGKISREEIDTLKLHPDANEIWISGLKQDTFEYFVDKFAKQFKAITFWKCPRIEDFSKLTALDNVEYLIFFWNQRVTHLWDLSKNIKLKGLSFDDFTRMHTLEEIPLAPVLEELYFGDKIWNKYIVDSLKPLAMANSLKRLSFSAKKIIDGDITPLAEIKKLQEVDFPSNLFTTRQVAWLAAKRSDTCSRNFAPYIKLKTPLEYPKGALKDLLVVGKRKPFLNSQKDKFKVAKYEQEFVAAVDYYRKSGDRPENI